MAIFTPTETGLRIGPKGIIAFAPGQTFPGNGTITGVTAGTDLTGGGTTGTVTLNLDTTKVPRLAAANTFTANQTVNGTVTATSFSGSGASLTNVNAAKLGGLVPGAYAQLAANNTFTGSEQRFNNFVIVGPKSDPAHVGGDKDVVDALRKIAATKALFISRGDHSGTHEAELRLWKEAGINVTAAGREWYREIGQGMGPALNMASSSNAYLLSDRGTWLSFKNKGELAILNQGDKRLFNQYGVMLVNPAKHPNVKAQDGQTFIAWLISPKGQEIIAGYKVGGEQLFFPNASH